MTLPHRPGSYRTRPRKSRPSWRWTAFVVFLGLGMLAASWADPPSGFAATCDIKGDVSDTSGAHLYHRRGQADYRAIQIDAARGELWFCSEAEAQAAGWIPARG